MISCENGRSKLVFLCVSDRQQAGVNFQKEMRQPFERRSPPEVDDVLGLIAASCAASQLNARPN